MNTTLVDYEMFIHILFFLSFPSHFLFGIYIHPKRNTSLVAEKIDLIKLGVVIGVCVFLIVLHGNVHVHEGHGMVKVVVVDMCVFCWKETWRGEVS